MKKTLVVLFAVMLLVPAGLFAGIFDFSVGATAQYKNGYDITSPEWGDDMTDIANYAFGADVRTRILFAEIGMTGLYSQIDNDVHQLDGLVTGGLSLDLLGLVRVGLGMGPRVTVTMAGDVVTFYGPDGALDADTDFVAAIMHAPLTYRATADFKLGNLLVGLNYTIDSNGFTLENQRLDKLLPASFESGRIGASVLFTLF